MVALLAGCSTAVKQEVLETRPPVVYKPVVIDENCATIAKYARAIGLYKNLGISIENVGFVVKNPDDFPAEAIKRQVYGNSNEDPLSESVSIYQICVQELYSRYIERLRREDLIYKFQEEQRLREEAMLKLKLEKELRSQPVPKKVKK